MVRTLSLRGRGVKVIARDGQGGTSIGTGNPPAILIAPYFGSNAGDCTATDRNFRCLLAPKLGENCRTAVRRG